MSGIVFNSTKNLKGIEKFYREKLNMKLWLRQEDCIILKHGNLLLGFCQRDKVDSDGIITFFYKTRDEVDEMYRKLKEIAASEPLENEKYEIYQFFASDPEGRTLEFQTFLHHIEPFMGK